MASADQGVAPMLVRAGFSEVLAISAITDPRWRVAELSALEVPATDAGLRFSHYLTQSAAKGLSSMKESRAIAPTALLHAGALAGLPPFGGERDETKRPALVQVAELIQESGAVGMIYLSGLNGLSVVPLLSAEERAASTAAVSAAIPNSGRPRMIRRGSVVSIELLDVQGLRPWQAPAPAGNALTKAERCAADARPRARMAASAMSMVDPAQRA